jgi:hypothetical protein
MCPVRSATYVPACTTRRGRDASTPRDYLQVAVAIKVHDHVADHDHVNVGVPS